MASVEHEGRDAAQAIEVDPGLLGRLRSICKLSTQLFGGDHPPGAIAVQRHTEGLCDLPSLADHQG